MQKILTFLIGIAILYTVFKGAMQDFSSKANNIVTPAPVNNSQTDKAAEPDLEGNLLERGISKVIINALKTEEGRLFFENLLKPAEKPIAGSEQGFKLNNDNFVVSMFNISTTGEGSGGAVSCGHVVTVDYKLSSVDNAILKQGSETFSLGSEKVAPGLDAVIVGMRVGQTREAIVPGKYATRNGRVPGERYKARVTLRRAMPQNFAEDSGVRVFDDEIAYKMPLVCGNNIAYHARVTKLFDGKIIYDTKKFDAKINMRIGDINYPIVFSHALHNKVPVGTRTVIAQGHLFQSFANKFSKIFPNQQLPKDEYFMLELFEFSEN